MNLILFQKTVFEKKKKFFRKVILSNFRERIFLKKVLYFKESVILYIFCIVLFSAMARHRKNIDVDESLVEYNF